MELIKRYSSTSLQVRTLIVLLKHDPYIQKCVGRTGPLIPPEKWEILLFQRDVTTGLAPPPQPLWLLDNW
jgi:hypothetical protein